MAFLWLLVMFLCHCYSHCSYQCQYALLKFVGKFHTVKPFIFQKPFNQLAVRVKGVIFVWYGLLIVKTCDVFCLTSIFVLTIRYFITHNVSLMFFSVSIKFYSRDFFSFMFFWYRLIYSSWGGKLDILITFLFFKMHNFF